MRLADRDYMRVRYRERSGAMPGRGWAAGAGSGARPGRHGAAIADSGWPRSDAHVTLPDGG